MIIDRERQKGQDLLRIFGKPMAAEFGNIFNERILEKQLGVTATAGGSFFASYGTHVRAMWDAFGEEATRFCDTDVKCEQAVDGAVATFECFARWTNQ